MSDNKIDISLIQFATYVRPDEQENKLRNWVLNGKDNSFYQYIIDRNAGSPTNGSINKTYTDLILGQGLSFKPTPGGSSKNAQDWARLKTILSDRDLKRIATDFQVFGAASLQIQTNNKNELISISHLPKEKVVPSIENEDGEIEGYWFSRDWSNIFRPENDPVYYPAFGTSKEGIEILVIKPYTVGMDYFESPDYISGLQYAESEEEISNMNINAIRNGLSAGFIINVKNGINFTDEEKRKFKKDVENKLTGSKNGGNFIISFGGEEVSVEVVPFPVASGIHKQWELLNDVCAQKILTAHRCPSPSIAGIISSSGFSNTAEEMDTAEAQLIKRVIAPKQRYIISGLEDVLQSYDINLDLMFKPLTEAPETSKEASTELSAHVCCGEKKKTNFSEDEGSLMLENLVGETISEEWELVDKRECLDDNEDVESWANRLIKPIELAAIKSKPSAESYLDKEVYKVRYTYQEKYSSGKSRSFCNEMIKRNDNGVVYRKEDIDQASFQGINKSFGHKGQSYSLFKYKGGVNCGHFWQEELYRLKKKTDGTFREDKALSSSEEVEKIPSKFIPKGKSFETSKVAPKDMPNNGHHPNYRKKAKK